jgi:predicted NAD/FAD-binding protein
MGVSRVAVVVNKLDAVGYQESIYQAIVDELAKVAARLEITDYQAIPVSALVGDNVIVRSNSMPWYSGPTLLEYIQTWDKADGVMDSPHMGIQLISRAENFRGLSGTVLNGTFAIGDEIVVLPSKRKAKISEIITYDGKLESISVGEFLDRHHYSNEFRHWYLLHMAGCIWSCPTEQMLAFPLATFVRFCSNHGLIQITNRPQWRTVTGGAKHYVQKMLPTIAHTFLNTPVRSVTRIGVGTPEIRIETATGTKIFEHVVLAAHSDQTLSILTDASADEKRILSAVRYQANRAILHTDTRCLPTLEKAWSAWNYETAGTPEPRVCVHYLINKLQPLPFQQSVIVTLNPVSRIEPEKIIAEFNYAHPIFDGEAIAAQHALPSIQGKRNTWFAGAWTGYRFHEDGHKSGLQVARAISERSLIA